MTAARRLGPTLLLNALRPKRMVPQPDTAPALVTSTKPGVGRLQSAGGANDKGGGRHAVGRMRTFPPSRSCAAAASRGASDRRPR